MYTHLFLYYKYSLHIKYEQKRERDATPIGIQPSYPSTYIMGESSPSKYIEVGENDPIATKHSQKIVKQTQGWRSYNQLKIEPKKHSQYAKLLVLFEPQKETNNSLSFIKSAHNRY